MSMSPKQLKKTKRSLSPYKYDPKAHRDLLRVDDSPLKKIKNCLEDAKLAKILPPGCLRLQSAERSMSPKKYLNRDILNQSPNSRVFDGGHSKGKNTLT